MDTRKWDRYSEISQNQIHSEISFIIPKKKFPVFFNQKCRKFFSRGAYFVDKNIQNYIFKTEIGINGLL
jgi:hypothetical protein